MKSRIILIVIIFVISTADAAFANIFSKFASQDSNNDSKKQADNVNAIPLIDTTDKLLQKRLQEAQSLIHEGRQLIKRGETSNRKDLITKGKIKEEIGSKQVEAIKQQVKDKKEQDKRDEW